MKRDGKGEGTDHSAQLIFISYCEPVFSLLGLNRKIFQQRDVPAKPSAIHCPNKVFQRTLTSRVGFFFNEVSIELKKLIFFLHSGMGNSSL